MSEVPTWGHGVSFPKIRLLEALPWVDPDRHPVTELLGIWLRLYLGLVFHICVLDRVRDKGVECRMVAHGQRHPRRLWPPVLSCFPLVIWACTVFTRQGPLFRQPGGQ